MLEPSLSGKWVFGGRDDGLSVERWFQNEVKLGEEEEKVKTEEGEEEVKLVGEEEEVRFGRDVVKV